MPSHIALQVRFLATVPVGAALETPAASNLRAPTRPISPPRGTQRPRTRHRRRMTTTVSSTSSFCRRRRRRLLSRLLRGRQAAGRGTTFGAGCAARRHTCTARARTQRHRLVLAAEVAARARAGPTWESERSSSVARARQGARRKGRAQVDGKWREGWEPLRPYSVLLGAWSRPQRAGGARSKERLHKFLHGGRIKGGPSQYPEEAAALAFFRVPRIRLSGFLGARPGDPSFR